MMNSVITTNTIAPRTVKMKKYRPDFLQNSVVRPNMIIVALTNFAMIVAMILKMIVI